MEVTVSGSLLLFLGITFCLFRCEARRSYRAEWDDHKFYYRIQAIGMVVTICSNMGLTYIYKLNGWHYNERRILD